MNITIFGTVKNHKKETVNISIHTDEIEELIKKKAVEAGVVGYEGRITIHYDEKIERIITGF